MDRIGRGMLAGLIATLILSGFMLLKAAIGAVPQANAIQGLTKISTMYLGLPLYPWIGWIWHFVIGTILWGIAFAMVVPALPGSYWLRGVLFSIGAWIAMMVIFMPLAGAGFFGFRLGIAAPITTGILHLIYGLALGLAYSWLQAGQRAEVQRA